MKKNLCLFVSLLLLLTGCGNNSETEVSMTMETAPSSILETTEAVDEAIPMQTQPSVVDYAYLYDDLLGNYRRYLESGQQDTWEPPYIIFDLYAQQGGEAINSVGYALQDISGDGVPELMIAGYQGEDGITDSLVYALYTLEEDKPVLVLDSAYRNAWYFAGDYFVNIGSDGAAYSIFGTFALSPDGQELICKDYFFTHEINGDFNNIGCFHNTTGAFGEEAGELLDLSMDDFWREEEKLRSQVFLPELTPFADFSGVGDPSYTESTWLFCDWAENVTPSYSRWDTVILTEDEYAVQIALEGGKLYDLQLLTLFVTDGGFEEEVAYTYGELKEGILLVLQLTFYGDLPSWGISYVDDRGMTHHKALSLSGDDGSLVLSDY